MVGAKLQSAWEFSVVARIPAYPDSGLTEKQQCAAHHLANGKTCRYAAQEAGVSERTLYQWRKRKVMQREIARIQSEMLEDAGGMNLSMQQIAISTLSEIMMDADKRDSDRIQAARTLMVGSQAYAERKILERKLSDLERQLGMSVRDEELAPIPELEETALLYAGSSEDDE